MPSAGSPDGITLGVIADDFTGASDAANMLTKGGVPTALVFNRCPDAVPKNFGACVVALKSRSIPAPEAIAQSLAALDGLRRLGARQVIFKICSTFDSTPAGNIGPVTEALADALEATSVIVCPAFPAAGRTVFQGHLFVFDKLLSESGMERHPINPLTDPDIRRWLVRQSKGAVGHLPLATLRAGREAIRQRLAAEAGAGRRLIVADAVENSDLMALGEAIADAPLATGGSGIALGLAPFHSRLAATEAFVGADGPAAILSGSCSNATRGQVDAYRRYHPALKLDVDSVISGGVTVLAAAAFVEANRGKAPLVYSSDDPDHVRAAQMRHGAEKLAQALDRFFGELANLTVASGVRRLVVAGGETSGAVVTALGDPLFAVGPEIAVGVPALSALDRPLAVALKSGNFGGENFFEEAVEALGGSG
jgi:3-dehydrotetronate 4-kinase